MSSIAPNPEEILKVVKSHQGPVVMINLLKFKAKAGGEEGTGADAYGRYAEAVSPMLAARGARIVWTGKPLAMVIGDAAKDWDAVVLVEYPSIQALIEMSSSAEYQKIHVHREAGLERTELIACAPLPAQALLK
ncbi:MAG TPA: DUF1330 domain-containing protein [Candidatus Acidoferrales bacterium]|nr:DUF1330 domain-containing protein [Candidatus Acidoferrales bacterium]